jgi:hypothetical protein
MNFTTPKPKRVAKCCASCGVKGALVYCFECTRKWPMLLRLVPAAAQPMNTLCGRLSTIASGHKAAS